MPSRVDARNSTILRLIATGSCNPLLASRRGGPIGCWTSPSFRGVLGPMALVYCSRDSVLGRHCVTGYLPRCAGGSARQGRRVTFRCPTQRVLPYGHAVQAFEWERQIHDDRGIGRRFDATSHGRCRNRLLDFACRPGPVPGSAGARALHPPVRIRASAGRKRPGGPDARL